MFRFFELRWFVPILVINYNSKSQRTLLKFKCIQTTGFHTEMSFSIKRKKYEATFHWVFIVYEIALVNVFVLQIFHCCFYTGATIGWNDGPAAVKCYFIWIMVAKEDRIRFAIKLFIYHGQTRSKVYAEETHFCT